VKGRTRSPTNANARPLERLYSMRNTASKEAKIAESADFIAIDAGKSPGQPFALPRRVEAY
jgi:hypothetical protein